MTPPGPARAPASAGVAGWKLREKFPKTVDFRQALLKIPPLGKLCQANRMTSQGTGNPVWAREAAMPEGTPDSKELGYYFSLAQVGLEMVVPLGIGAALDYSLGWKPWGVIGGAVLGFVGGLTHLIMLVNRHDDAGPSKAGGGQP